MATLKKDGSTYSSTVGSVGAYLLSNGSYVTRQMYQEYNMNFVIAFNNSVPITEGSGTSSSPYIIDTNWTG